MVRQRGMALLGVLWTGVILALLAGGVLDVSRGDLDLARNQADGARAELAAEAAAEIAILGVLQGGEDAIREDGAVYAWAFDDAEVRVQVLSESGRIDLNNADEELLTALFVLAGADADAARALSHAVIDFRDEDNIPMDAGAEDDDYAAAGRFLGAKDAPYTNIEELMGVLGMTPEIYRFVSPGLTVHLGRRNPGIEALPPIVSAVLGDSVSPPPPTPAFSADLAATPERITEPLGAAAERSALSHIHAEAVTRGGSVYALDLVVQPRPGLRRPYELVDRRRGEVELFALPGTGDEN